MVGYSFIGSPADAQQLSSALAEYGGRPIGILLKIERNVAYERLPSLLLEGMRHPVMGVMIARGDPRRRMRLRPDGRDPRGDPLALHSSPRPRDMGNSGDGSAREAGPPIPGEVTDAAMGGCAECMMLNKCPHRADAIRLSASSAGCRTTSRRRGPCCTASKSPRISSMQTR